MIDALLPAPAEAAVFATAVLVLNATPGVDFVLTTTRTLQAGPRAGLAAAAGIGAGCVVHALAAAFGLAALLALHPGAFGVLQWAGAAYLVWLGIGLLRAALRPAAAAPAGLVAAGVAPRGGPHAARWADFRTGLLTNVLNPKVALFFLAFLPPFVPATSPSKTASFLLLGAWFVIQGAAFLALLVAVVARLGRAGGSPAVRRTLQALGGGLFLLLALRLLGESTAVMAGPNGATR
jgi:threonine/homoserine/homoserine lactone efflux protein